MPNLRRNAREDARYYWHEVDYEWSRTREHWSDSTTRFFEQHWWHPLNKETRELLDALDELIPVLREAQEIAKIRY